MPKRCSRCGNFAMDDERFCTRCGENLDTATYASCGQTTNYTNPYAPNHANNNSEMSFGKWVLTVLVTTAFGIISFVFLFMWAFGEGPESRRRYCKAMLIVKGILTIISIFVALLWFRLIDSMAYDYYRYFDDNDGYYYYDEYDDEYDDEYGQDVSEVVNKWHISH